METQQRFPVTKEVKEYELFRQDMIQDLQRQSHIPHQAISDLHLALEAWEEEWHMAWEEVLEEAWQAHAPKFQATQEQAEAEWAEAPCRVVNLTVDQAADLIDKCHVQFSISCLIIFIPNAPKSPLLGLINIAEASP